MTNIRTFWAPAPDTQTTPQVRVMTPQGTGHIWQGTPLEVQLERGRLAVVLDGVTTGARYYNVDEVTFEGGNDEPRIA